jgi:alpha-beta hydrolase superfamily lysophospholipase
MGGGIVLNFVEKYVDAPYAKVMVESPWLELAKPMPGIVTRFARLVGKITPNMAIPSGLDLDAITRDPAVTAQTKADPLFHTRISLRLYAAVYDAGQYTIAHANAITLPTLVMLGTNDRIISTEAIRRLAANAGMNLTLQEFAGAYHCLHNETNAAEVRQKMLDFIA